MTSLIVLSKILQFFRKFSHLDQIFRNISWLMFDQAIRMGVGFFVGVWIARYLGPEQFGLLSFATAFVGIFSILAGLGLRHVVVRALLDEPESKSEILGSAAFLQIISGLLTFGIVVAVIYLLRPNDAQAVRLVTVLSMTVLFNFSDVVTYWFEAEVASKYVVWVRSGVYLVFVTIKVGLIVSGAPLNAFAYALMGEVAVAGVFLIILFSAIGQPIHLLTVSLDRVRGLIGASWPVILSGFALMVQAKVDQVMLGQMIADKEVAYYSSALRVVEAAAVFSVILQSSFMPHIISARKRSEFLFWEKLEKFYKLNALICIPICLALLLGSYPIITLTFGPEYTPAAMILAVMSFRMIFAHMGAARGIFLLSEDLLRYSALTMIVGTVANVIFNWLLIPAHGGVGATVASLISFFITIVGIDLFFPRARRNAKLMLLSFFTCGSILSRKSWES